MDLQNKVAVVTGAAHRIGKSIALGLAEVGAQVVVHYHQAADDAHTTVAEIKQKNVRAVAVGGDLGTKAGVDSLFHTAAAEFGGVDILINSAAIMEAGDLLTLTREAWH